MDTFSMRGRPYQLIAWLSQADEDKLYEVKEVRKRRSLTQNAYYWSMLNQLARALGMSDSELHLNMLREYGVAEVMSLSMKVPAHDYFDYCDVVSTDFYDGEMRQIVKVYKGSSRMDSAEFTRLIQGMREECELQGIDVMTPQEIAQMRFIEPKKE